MYRRQLLISVGSSFAAGCTGISTQEDNKGHRSSKKTTTSDTVPDIDFPKVTTEADEFSDEREIKIEVETEQSFSEAHPARIRIRFTNTADETRRFSFGATPPFTEYVGKHTTDSTKLVAVPDDRERIFDADPVEKTPDDETETATRYRLVPTEPINRCWYAGGVPASAAIEKTPILEPKGTITEQYTVLAHPLNEQCLSVGEYRFEKKTYFEEKQKNESWGFSVFLNDSIS